MSADSAFLAAILAAPADDGLRLVYADYLADSDRPADLARAEFIRVQLALSRLPTDHPRTTDLVARQAELLQQHHAVWTAPIRGLVAGAEFRRGLLDAVSIESRHFLEHGLELFRRIPLRRVHLLNSASLLEPLAASPLLGRIRELDLAGTELGNGGLNVLLRSQYLTTAETLDLSFNGLDDRGASRLAEANTLPALRTLVLTDNRIGSVGARRLAEANWFPRIRVLDLSANAVGAEGIQAIANKAGGKLAALRIGSNPIGNTGVTSLVGSPLIARLFVHDSHLVLRRTECSAAGCAAFAASPFLSALTSLDLSENEIDSACLRALTTGSFPKLRFITLRGNQIDDDGAQALARSPLMRTLAQIDLANNKLSQAGVDALLAARNGPKVAIDVSGNFIDM